MPSFKTQGTIVNQDVQDAIKVTTIWQNFESTGEIKGSILKSSTTRFSVKNGGTIERRKVTPKCNSLLEGKVAKRRICNLNELKQLKQMF